MSLQGADDLRRRIKALKLVFKDVGKRWGDNAANRMRPQVPVRSGRLRRSFRVRASQRQASVRGHFTAYFIDAGTKPHTIQPRQARMLAWSQGGNTIFAKRVRHPGMRKRPFRAEAARKALRETAGAEQFVKGWNDAA